MKNDVCGNISELVMDELIQIWDMLYPNEEKCTHENVDLHGNRQVTVIKEWHRRHSCIRLNGGNTFVIKFLKDQLPSVFPNDWFIVELGTLNDYKSSKIIDGSYLCYAEVAFAIAHKLVACMKLNQDETGTLWSVIKNVFRKIDYVFIADMAIQTSLQAKELENYLCKLSVPQLAIEQGFHNILIDYSKTLSQVCDVYRQRCLFLRKASDSLFEPHTKYLDFKNIVNEEDRLLQKCQEIGDVLTKLYRQYRDIHIMAE